MYRSRVAVAALLTMLVMSTSVTPTEAGGWGRGPSWKQAKKDGGKALRAAGKVAVAVVTVVFAGAAGSKNRNNPEGPATIEVDTAPRKGGGTTTIMTPGPGHPVDSGSNGNVHYHDYTKTPSNPTYAPGASTNGNSTR